MRLTEGWTWWVSRIRDFIAVIKWNLMSIYFLSLLIKGTSSLSKNPLARKVWYISHYWGSSWFKELKLWIASLDGASVPLPTQLSVAIEEKHGGSILNSCPSVHAWLILKAEPPTQNLWLFHQMLCLGKMNIIEMICFICLRWISLTTTTTRAPA